MGRRIIHLLLAAALFCLLLTGCNKAAAPVHPAAPAVPTQTAVNNELPVAPAPEPAVIAPPVPEKTPEPEPEPVRIPEPEPEPEDIVYTAEDLEMLTGLEHFTKSAVEHIFLGQVNKKGAATGYHYDGITDSPGYIVEGTKTPADENGVYTGKVEVNGAKKTGNKGYSSFYPAEWSPQEVIDSINEAYENRELLRGNLYAGLTEDGIEIDMALDNKERIITAYPIKED